MSRRSLDQLSDGALREMLVERGFPTLPITETTRKFLIKKLQRQTRNQNLEISQRITNHDRKSRAQFQTPESVYNLHQIGRNRYILGNENKKFAFERSGRKEFAPISSNEGLNARSKMSVSPLQTLDTDADPMLFNSEFMKRQTNPLNQYKLLKHWDRKNSHIGVVNRLLSFRESKTHKVPLMGSCNDSKDLPKPPLSEEPEQYRMKTCGIFGNVMSYIKVNPRCNQLFVSYVLVFIFVMFFLFLAFMYAIISPDMLDINENTTQFVICNEGNKILASDFPTCIDDNQVTGVFQLLNELLQFLRERERNHYCNRNKKDIEISINDFITHKHANGNIMDMEELAMNLMTVEYLIKSNPQLKIVIDRPSTAALDPKSITTFREVYFSFNRPTLPLLCILYNKIQTCFVIIGTGAIIAVFSFLCYLAYKYIKSWQDQRHYVVDQFITDIINEIIYRASLSEVPKEREVIINHLRDKLIPLNKRSTYMKAWNEAMRMLEVNDSRIQFGITTCNGEEFRTIKWIGNEKSTTRQDWLTKKWQSPAFDNTNRITSPPTPCLKIRHMFDASEINHPYLKQIIEEAILEKVGTRCNIQDIQIDKNSCCVYVRCASLSDAGIIHNEMNGWWFDKRLISIKFLRLQRYLSRFPSATNVMSIY